MHFDIFTFCEFAYKLDTTVTSDTLTATEYLTGINFYFPPKPFGRLLDVSGNVKWTRVFVSTTRNR